MSEPIEPLEPLDIGCCVIVAIICFTILVLVGAFR